jgi:hypothetical protein
MYKRYVKQKNTKQAICNNLDNRQVAQVNVLQSMYYITSMLN